MGKKPKLLTKSGAAGHVVNNPRSPIVSIKNRLIAYLSLSLICILAYINTSKNDYALDDSMMITENKITQQGFGGIGEHISHGFLYGYMGKEGSDIGSSHWRPLVMVSFAIEYELWETSPANSHLLNLALYLITVLLLFKMLYKYLLNDLWLAFITAALFAVHPVHTEVVANIKGRDEILCLLFLLLSILQLWRSADKKKWLPYIFSLLLFFLSLTAKETSITFLAGIPLMLVFFSSFTFKKIAWLSLGFLGVAAIYVVIKNSILPFSEVGMEENIVNNAYLYANWQEAFCTKIFAMLLYLKLLLFPHPLIYDYSYNHISYVGFSEPWVWVSMVIYLAMFIYAVSRMRSKDILAFSIFMFLITMVVASNLVVNTGVMLAERMLFIPSIFAMMAIVIIGNRIITSLKLRSESHKKIMTATLVIPAMIVMTMLTFIRNEDWKDDTTLNLADIKKAPQSARLNGGAATAYVSLADEPAQTTLKKDSLLSLSIYHYKKALSIDSTYYDPWLNLGIAYSKTGNMLMAEETWNALRKRDPTNPRFKELDGFLASSFYNIGENAQNKDQLDTAIKYFEKVSVYAIPGDSLHLSALYRQAGSYYRLNQFKPALEKLETIFGLNADFLEVKNAIKDCKERIRQFQ